MLTVLILSSRITIYTNMNGVKFAAGGSGWGAEISRNSEH